MRSGSRRRHAFLARPPNESPSPPLPSLPSLTGSHELHEEHFNNLDGRIGEQERNAAEDQLKRQKAEEYTCD
jgi:hypothetical protein